MRRRMIFWLAAGGLLAGCGPRAAAPAASASRAPVDRAPVAADYRWFGQVAELRKGFCFAWVRELRPQQVLKRMSGKELERVGWQQLVGSGDGQQGQDDRFFFGVARVGEWSLVIEDNGGLGLADDLLRPLSAGTTLVSHHRGADGHGRFVLMTDREIELEFDPAADARRLGSRAAELGLMMEASGFGAAAGVDHRTEAAFALTERLTGVPLTLAMLQESTYLFSVARRG